MNLPHLPATGYGPQYLTLSELSSYYPYQSLVSINPEIGTTAIAHKAGIIDPQILPYLAHTRELQSEEYINLLANMTEQARIAAGERVSKSAHQTLISLRELKESGKTKRHQISADTALDIHRLRYEGLVRLLESEGQTRRYLSDNEIKRAYLQAEATRDLIVAREKINAELQRGLSRDQLAARVLEIERTYAAKMYEQEQLSDRYALEKRNEIIVAHMHATIEMARITLGIANAQHETSQEVIKGAFETLKQAGVKSISGSIVTPTGTHTVDLKADRA